MRDVKSALQCGLTLWNAVKGNAVTEVVVVEARPCPFEQSLVSQSVHADHHVLVWRDTDFAALETLPATIAAGHFLFGAYHTPKRAVSRTI